MAIFIIIIGFFTSSELWLLIGCATFVMAIILATVSIWSPDGWRGRYAQQLNSSDKYFATRKTLNCHNAMWSSLGSLVMMVCTFILLVAASTKVNRINLVMDQELHTN